jgi:hypothetical protein
MNFATQKILMFEKDWGEMLLKHKKFGSFGIFRVPQNVIKVDLFLFFPFLPKKFGRSEKSFG